MSSEGVWNELVSINEQYLLNAAVGGPIGISCDLTKLSSRLLDRLTEYFAEYKSQSEFWKNAECHLLVDTDSMLVMQFNDKEYSELEILVFAKHVYQTAVTVYPVCSDNANYSDGENTYSAKELIDNGFEAEIKDHFATCKFNLKKI